LAIKIDHPVEPAGLFLALDGDNGGQAVFSLAIETSGRS
jgi:hypothetical protein